MVGILAIACSQKEKPQINNAYELGKYIYRDDNDIHHINSRCIKLRHGKDDDGHEIYAMHPIDTVEFFIGENDYFRVCSRCVNDNTFDHILDISHRNKKVSDSRHWLYNKLIEANYDMPDYKIYSEKINDDKVRSQLYQVAQNENWNVGESEKEFSKLLGF